MTAKPKSFYGGGLVSLPGLAASGFEAIGLFARPDFASLFFGNGVGFEVVCVAAVGLGE
jgi:hypothetical protein